MGGRELGWVVYLAGLPLAPFLLRLLRVPQESMDLWHAQSLWAMAGALVLAVSVWTGPARHTETNGPVRWYGWYVVGTFLYLSTTWMMDQKTYHFPLMMFAGHLLLLLVWYGIAVQTWEPLLLEQIVRVMTIVALVLCAYGLAQAFGGDQFFRTTLGEGDHGLDFPRNHRVIGTLGNPSHFAAYLSCAAPGLLLLKRPWALSGAAVLAATLAYTQAWGGVLALLVAIAWMLTPKWRWLLLYGVVGLCGVGIMFYHHPNYFSWSGRWDRWSLFWQMFQAKPITGLGPGAVYGLVSQITDTTHRLYHWRHVHQEWLQLGIEQGLIGVGLVGAIVLRSLRQAWIMRQQPLGLVLGASLVAFLMNSLYNFPAHLWAVGVFGLVAVCGLEVVNRERTA